MNTYAPILLLAGLIRKCGYILIHRDQLQQQKNELLTQVKAKYQDKIDTEKRISCLLKAQLQAMEEQLRFYKESSFKFLTNA